MHKEPPPRSNTNNEEIQSEYTERMKSQSLEEIKKIPLEVRKEIPHYLGGLFRPAPCSPMWTEYHKTAVGRATSVDSVSEQKEINREDQLEIQQRRIEEQSGIKRKDIEEFLKKQRKNREYKMKIFTISKL